MSDRTQAETVQRTGDQGYELPKIDPSHPSLHFKKVGKYWIGQYE